MRLSRVSGWLTCVSAAAVQIGHALISGEMVRETGVARRPTHFARDLAPCRALEGRKSGVTVEIALDLGKIQKGGQRQRRTVERFATDHEYRVLPDRKRQRFFERMRHRRAVDQKSGLAAYDDVLSVWQRFADRLPGFATHDHRVTGSKRPKMFQVFRQVPRHAVTGTDHAVSPPRGEHRPPPPAGGRAWRCAEGWCILHA